MSKTNNNVQVGTKELGAVADSEDDNPNEVIGFLKFSTTGEVLVPREWLQERWEESELPQNIFPTQTTNWQAFRRTISWLQDQTKFLEYKVYNDHYGQKFDCKLEIEKSNELGSNVYLVSGKTFFPEDICGKTGGDWDENRIGMFDFHRPEDNDLPGRMITEREIDEDNGHYEQLTNLFDTARNKEKEMRQTHNFNDLQNILEGYRDIITDAVEIRRSVYFVPAHHQETLDAIMGIWGEMNRFKEGGEEMRIDKTPVVDMKEQRELVASRVREKLQGMVDDIVSEIITEFEDNDEQTADAAANEIMNQLEDSENFSSTYNQLLGMRLSIKEILEERRTELQEESEEVIDNVLNQQTFEELE